MIGRIRGILLEKQAPLLMIEAGGVGYEIQTPMTTFYKLPDIGKEVTLHTHLVVREDIQSLYGFSKKQEKTLFRSLIRISGVGPKLALTILSGVDPNTFVQYVMDSNITTLVRLPGIGKKTAQRLLVEMRDHLQNWGMDGHTGSVIDNLGQGDNTAVRDAVGALISLGYKPHEASKAVAKHKDENVSSEELIRLVLKNIAK